jgi:hypothetical protein
VEWIPLAQDRNRWLALANRWWILGFWCHGVGCLVSFLRVLSTKCIKWTNSGKACSCTCFMSKYAENLDEIRICRAFFHVLRFLSCAREPSEVTQSRYLSQLTYPSWAHE